MAAITIRCTEPADAEFLQAVIADWWGHPIESDMLTRNFLTHFRDTCLVAERAGHITGFLVGFFSQSLAEEAYIRLVVTDPQCRGRGIGRMLYERFFEVARRHGRTTIRCVTSPSNKAAVAFHMSLGFSMEPQEHSQDGLPVWPNYHGRPGTDRVLFVKRL